MENKISFKLKSDNKVLIMRDEKEIGQIFTPSSSGNNILNAIQVCGFSEAFDLWGCGPFKGFKDIQLLFDGKMMGGKSEFSVYKCHSCFRDPCQCEVRLPSLNPFTVKRQTDLEERIKEETKK